MNSLTHLTGKRKELEENKTPPKIVNDDKSLNKKSSSILSDTYKKEGKSNN